MKKKLFLAILTGLLFAAALPPFKTGFLAYLALVPFYFQLKDLGIKDAFRWGYVTGVFVDIFTLFWIAWVTKAGFFGALLILPLYFSIYAVLHVYIVMNLKKWAYIILPFLWVFIEYIQSVSEIAFPWNYLGYTQSYYLHFIQIADITSVFGLSFWIACLNVLIYLSILNRDKLSAIFRFAAIFVIIFILPLMYGVYKFKTFHSSKNKIKVALVQGNIDPFEKWNRDLEESHFNIYADHTAKASLNDADLVIWPETATAFYLRYEAKYLQRVRDMLDTTKTALITGSIDFSYDSTNAFIYFNSALGFQPNLPYIQRYSKMILVPFSEKVPYLNYFPFNLLKHLLFDMELGIGNYTKGDKYKLFSFSTRSIYEKEPYGYRYKVAVPICFESVFPNHIRLLTRKGADMLAIITNDAWFGKTTAPYQHTQIAVFRAIENRIPVARCANTGISCFIDPLGRVSDQTEIFKVADAEKVIELNKVDTLYKTFGNIFAQIASSIALIAALFSIALHIKSRGRRINNLNVN